MSFVSNFHRYRHAFASVSGVSMIREFSTPKETSFLSSVLSDRSLIKDGIRFAIFIAVALVSLRVAALLVFSQFHHTNILHFGEYGLARHLDGTVYRPFAYRVLTDWLARLVLALHLPQHTLPYLDPIVADACPAQRATPAATCEQVKAYVIVGTAFAWGFLACTYLIALRFVGGPLWAIVSTAFAALIVNSLQLQGYGQPYDFVTLFFATNLFFLAARQQDVAFALLLCVACLAKESLALFIIVFAVIAYGNRPIRQILCNLSVQTMVFVVVYGWERIEFAHNLGASMYHNIAGHVRYISDNTTIYSISCALLFSILLLYRLPKKPSVLRRSMMVLPILVILYFGGGQPGEFRIAVDVFPIILLPMADTLRRLFTGADHADVLAYELPTRFLPAFPREPSSAVASDELGLARS